MRKIKLLTLAVPFFSSLIIFSACSKSDNKGNTQLRIKMTDAPFNAQEVNVDIREVRVKFTGEQDTLSWVPLTTNARIYNLLTLQNNRDTIVAAGSVPTGTLQEVRFILGPNNSIRIDDVNYPLSVSSADQSGLKIKVGKMLASTADSLRLDFDAEQSIIQTGNGTYKLKPVIKVK